MILAWARLSESGGMIYILLESIRDMSWFLQLVTPESEMPLRKLDEEEMKKVTALAQALREKGRDKYKLGYALLYLQERNKMLEDVRKKAEYYVRFGMGEKELSNLRLALEKMHELDAAGTDDSSFFAKE